MDLVLYARMPSNEVLEIARYDGLENFQECLKEAIDRKATFGSSEDVDKVVDLFSKGASVSRKQIRTLKAAFRNFDEVYLCNEIVEALGEVPREAICMSLSNECSLDCVDLDEYDV